MKTILSIDGGGIRGIIPLACLVKLESREGRPLHEMFDMVAGTSTGAVISAGIALGISSRGLLALYRNLALEAFEELPWWQILLNLGNHRYDNAFIARTLDVLGADRTLNSLPLDILITGKNTTTGRTDFFVRDNPGNAGLWGTLSLKDAVLASIAAPTYFPAHSAVVLGEEHTWVDGGVSVAGNPVYHAAVEALHFTDGAYEPGDVRMFSFGTGRTPHRIDPQRASFFHWASWTLSELMDDASEWQTAVAQREYEKTGRISLRRYQIDLANDILDEIGVSLPPGRTPEDLTLDAVWAVDTLEAIGRAFSDRIDFDAPGGLHLRTEEGW